MDRKPVMMRGRIERPEIEVHKKAHFALGVFGDCISDTERERVCVGVLMEVTRGTRAVQYEGSVVPSVTCLGVTRHQKASFDQSQVSQSEEWKRERTFALYGTTYLTPLHYTRSKTHGPNQTLIHIRDKTRISPNFTTASTALLRRETKTD